MNKLSASTKQPFPNLVTELRQLCAEGATGLVVISPSGAKLARLTLDAGKLVHISFQEKKGVDALALLKTIDTGQLEFFKGLGEAQRSRLPPTADILADLAASALPGRHQGAEVDATASRGKSQLLGSHARSILQETLAEHIGPMATIVCESYLLPTQDLETAIRALAKEIPDAESSRSFIENVRDKLA